MEIVSLFYLGLHLFIYCTPPFLFIRLKQKEMLISFYTYFTILFFLCQIFGNLYALAITDQLILTGGNISYCALVYTTLIIVFKIPEPQIIRNLIYVLLSLTIFVSLLYFLLYLILNSNISINFFSIPSEFLISTIASNFVSLFLYTILIPNMFLLLELSKKHLKNITLSTICIIGIFILILSLDGASFMPLLSLTGYAPDFSIWMQILGKIILGFGYGFMLGIFLLFNKIPVQTYLLNKFKILQLILPPKHQELVEQLKQTQEELHTLRKLLPICASCKKIRNDKGYWQQVEQYFADHSEYIFSHSLCPECVKKIYPELIP